MIDLRDIEEEITAILNQMTEAQLLTKLRDQGFDVEIDHSIEVVSGT